MQKELLEKILGKENIKYNEPMSKHTTFKIGGKADIFAKVHSETQMLELLDNLDTTDKITIIGNGSNILVKDKRNSWHCNKICSR